MIPQNSFYKSLKKYVFYQTLHTRWDTNSFRDFSFQGVLLWCCKIVQSTTQFTYNLKENTFPKCASAIIKGKQSGPVFQLDSLFPFPTTMTLIQRIYQNFCLNNICYYIGKYQIRKPHKQYIYHA